MAVDPTNAHELAGIASEIGTDVLSGDWRPSDNDGRQLGDLGPNEYLDCYRGQRPLLPIAPVGAKPETQGVGEVARGDPVTLGSVCCGTEQAVTRAEAA
jgi:hypothetical protein